MDAAAVHQMQRYNCAPCRKRKSKCDRAKPCMSCVLRSTEAYCYTDNDMSGTSAPNTTAAASAASAQAASSTTATTTTTTHKHGLYTSPGGSVSGEVSSASRPNKVARYVSAAVSGSNSPSSSNNRTAALQAALDSMTSSLQEARKLVNTGFVQDSLSQWGEMVEWDDLETLLPPDEERQEIFHCFFNDLGWYQTGVSEIQFERMWSAASRQRKAIPRYHLALVCAMIAFTTLLAPRCHPASRLPDKPSTNPRWQIENARLLIEAFYHFPTHKEEDEDNNLSTMLGPEEDVLGQLQAETLFCYYCAVAGLSKKCFLSVGRAIHLGKGIRLFDEARWTVYDEPLREARRGIVWDMVTMDRWCSMHGGYAGELMRDINVRVPLSTDTFGDYRNKLAFLIKLVFDFMQRSPAMDMNSRVANAYETDAEVVRFYASLPSEVQFDNVKDRLGGHDARANYNAGPSLTYYFSYLYLRCALAQQFLMDPAAPIELRFASLQHARSTIEAMPYLVTLTSSPYVSFPPAWNSQFLFSAAAIFASVVLSKDDEPFSNGSRTSTAAATAARNRIVWPDDELDWFAATLVDVVETFDLVSHGAFDHTARTCKNLLVALCTSRETLRERFRERERTRRDEVLGYNGDPQRRRKAQEASRRRSGGLPSIFSSSASPSSNGGGEAVRASVSTYSRAQPSGMTPTTDFTRSSGDEGQSSYSSGSSGFTPISAGEVLASMAAPTGTSTAASAEASNSGETFGFDTFGGFELPFLEPQEWARLTANLGGGGVAS